MEKQKQATRRRLARLAYDCGFERFSGAKNSAVGFTELFNQVPDEALCEVEAILKDYQELQEALRSPN